MTKEEAMKTTFDSARLLSVGPFVISRRKNSEPRIYWNAGGLAIFAANGEEERTFPTNSDAFDYLWEERKDEVLEHEREKRER